MVTFILLVVVIAVVGYSIALKATDSTIDGEGGCLVVGIIVFFAFAGSILITTGISSFMPTINPAVHFAVTKYSLADLKAMSSTTSSFSGDFYLGSGTVSGSTTTTTEYVYYYQLPNGGYKLGELSTDEDITIFQQNRKDGQLVITDREQDSCPKNQWYFTTCTTAKNLGISYAFYIPKGSIRTGFSLG